MSGLGTLSGDHEVRTFRRRATEADALQWDGSAEGLEAIREWGAEVHPANPWPAGGRVATLRVPTGWVTIEPGHWVVKRSDDDFYPVSPDDFEELYEPTTQQKGTVCIDLDGVLNLYRGWKGPDYWPSPRPGAQQFVRELIDDGYQVVVLTSRSLVGAVMWLYQFRFPIRELELTNVKPAAIAYIDDRGVRFAGSFDHAYHAVRHQKAHWERDPGVVVDTESVPGIIGAIGAKDQQGADG